MPEERRTRLPVWLGCSLLVSAVAAWLGAYLDSRRSHVMFVDELGNEVSIGSDATLPLVVLGIVLAVNGVALLAWDRSSR
jgi:hypothetical protein